MKISKGEITLVVGTVAIVGAVLIGGVWWSHQNTTDETTARQAQTAKVRKALRSALVAEPAQAKAVAGIYQTKHRSGGYTTIELKPNGEFVVFNDKAVMPFYFPLKGTFTLSNKDITLFTQRGLAPPQISKFCTARFTSKGFMPARGSFLDAYAAIGSKHYVKIS